MPDQVPDKSAANLPIIRWEEFIGTVPPGKYRRVWDAVEPADGLIGWFRIAPRRVDFECGECDGTRSFNLVNEPIRFQLVIDREVVDFILKFACANCMRFEKRIGVMLSARPRSGTEVDDVWAIKIGEFPAFGISVPSRVLAFVGPDRDAFLKGRRCENQGLGVGAFAYYRRVVENQKGRILEKIRDVAATTGAKPEVIAALEAAAKETQFSTAVDRVKPGFPDSLLIDGHNPLTLLHSALSQGIHSDSDEACLELAHDIRVVLFDLAERVSIALSDHTELKKSVSRLLNPKPKKPPGAPVQPAENTTGG